MGFQRHEPCSRLHGSLLGAAVAVAQHSLGNRAPASVLGACPQEQGPRGLWLLGSCSCEFVACDYTCDVLRQSGAMAIHMRSNSKASANGILGFLGSSKSGRILRHLTGPPSPHLPPKTCHGYICPYTPASHPALSKILPKYAQVLGRSLPCGGIELRSGNQAPKQFNKGTSTALTRTTLQEVSGATTEFNVHCYGFAGRGLKLSNHACRQAASPTPPPANG